MTDRERAMQAFSAYAATLFVWWVLWWAAPQDPSWTYSMLAALTGPVLGLGFVVYLERPRS